MIPKKPKQQPKQFNFSKLPLLALEHIVAVMHISEVIGLCLCSKRTTEMFRSVRNTPAARLIVHVIKDSPFLMLYDIGTASSLEWNFLTKAPRKFKKDVWNINGTKIVSGIDKVDDNMVYFNSVGRSNQLAHYLNTIISYILFALPKCSVDELVLHFCTTSNFNYRKAIAPIKSTQRLLLFDDTHSRNAQFAMSNIKVTDTYIQDGVYLGGKCYHSLDLTKSLDCKDASWMLPETLMELNCESVKLHHTRFSNEDLLNFLRKWKSSSGDQMKNIECMLIGMNDKTPLDYEEFNGMTGDENRRAQRFRSPTSEVYDLTDGIDIERSDGLLATVLFPFFQSFFLFCVWHDRFPLIENDEENEGEGDLLRI